MITCEDCVYWDTSPELIDAQPGTGKCRFNPPVLDKRSGRGMWPVTEDVDSCGSAQPAPEFLEIYKLQRGNDDA